MSPTVEVVVGSPATALGEGPHWDAERQELYYVDFFSSAIHRHVPSTGEFYKVDVGGRSSIIIPIQGFKDRYLLEIGIELKQMIWDGKSEKPIEIKTLVKLDKGDPKSQFNDGKCDSKGRLWTGTLKTDLETGKLSSGAGEFYSFDKNGNSMKQFGDVDCSNGLAWSGDEKTFYYVDSLKKNVQAWDFDKEKGTLSNHHIVYDLKGEKDFNEKDSVLDGMTIDNQGNLWIAVFNGSKVIQVNPNTGKRLQEVKLPCSKITSVIFGGKDLDVLYVVSGNVDLPGFENSPNDVDAGKLFAIKGLGVKGLRGMYNYVFDG